MSNPYYLSEGSHPTREAGMCAMEWVAYIAGEEHSDKPVCVDPPLRRFGIGMNDNLPDDLRQRLRPYLARCIGTAGDGRTAERGFMLADWAVRVAAPEGLEARGLKEWADRLRALSPIMDRESALAARDVAREARKAAYAAVAADAAVDAAVDAAADAAAAAYAAVAADAVADAAAVADADADAAAAAAAYAAADAAVDAAVDAAAYAARRAMWEKLLPSALDLFDRMLPTEIVELPALPEVAAELTAVVA